MWRNISVAITSGYGRILSVSIWAILPILFIVLTIVGLIPSLADIASNSQEDFLPDGAESTRALKLQEKYFPRSGLQGVLVYHKTDGIGPEELTTIERDVTWLKERALESPLLGNVASQFDNPGLSKLSFSQDASTLLTFIAFSTYDSLPVEELQEEIRTIRNHLGREPNDAVQVYLTGPAGVVEDAVSVFQSIDFRITAMSILLVLVILLIIYRLAVILAILPVISAGLAYILAGAIVAILAEKAGLVVNAQATSIMVVLIFGAGTDYMLFISSRFRDHLKQGKSSNLAMADTLSSVGPAIFSSALTTILAMLILISATLRSYQVLGPILALGMAFAIAAGLTFIPAILTILGKKAYWPSKITVQHNGTGNDSLRRPSPEGLWATIAQFISKKPATVAIISVVILSLMSIGLVKYQPSYNLLASLPENAESVQGYTIMRESFPSGSVAPTQIFIRTRQNPIEDLDLIESFSKAITSIDGVNNVTGPTRPYGEQVTMPLDRYGSFLSTMYSSDRANTERDKTKYAATLNIPNGIDLDSAALMNLAISTQSHISTLGPLVRLDVTFVESPILPETLMKISDIRNVSEKYLADFDEILVGGETAINYDTKVASERDVKVMGPLVLIIIFLVLAVLVRAIIAPLYLLGSVLLSFLASLGISILFFRYVLGHDGIGSGVPIFMFIFLVALGVDYNIYIISRVREEARHFRIKKATIIAVSNTGGVITSAGIILAGTFTALTTLPLRDLFQLGFVVAIGVLIDTFFVRGIVVPSFIMMLGKWNWWPSKPTIDDH